MSSLHRKFHPHYVPVAPSTMSGAGHVYSYGDSHGYTHQHGTSITPYRERYINQDHRGSANLTTRPYKHQTSTSTYSKQERVITPEKASYSPVRPSTSYAPVRGTGPSTSYIPPFEYTPAPLQLSLHDYPVVDRRTYTPTETYVSQPIFRRSAPSKTLSDDALAQTITRPQPHTARSFSSSLGRTGTSTFISRPGYSNEQTEAMNNYCKYSLSRRVPENQMKQGYLPGYMGFVRSSQFKHGHTFGKTSRECMDEMPLDRPRI